MPSHKIQWEGIGLFNRFVLIFGLCFAHAIYEGT